MRRSRISKALRGKTAACHAVARFKRRRVKTRITPAYAVLRRGRRILTRHELHELSRISAASFFQHRLVGNSGTFNVSTVQRFNVAKPLV